MEKSANKRWRESGSSLTFKEWIDRENKKKTSKSFVRFDSKALEKDIKDTISYDYNSALFKPNPIVVKEEADKGKVFGLSKTTLILSGLVIAGSLTYLFIQRAKRNK